MGGDWRPRGGWPTAARGPGRGPRPLVAAAQRALGERNLVLVGFMGTGKSALGRRAAAALGRPFRDTDRMVEHATGCRIAELFATRGEPAFRELEAQAVAQVAAARRQVVSTGGGVLGREANRRALRATGVLVALQARPEVILQRVGGGAAGLGRPLLAVADPLERIRALLAERAAWYADADLTLDTSDRDLDALLLALLQALSHWHGGGGT